MSLSTASEASFGPLNRQMNRMMDPLSKGYFSFCPGQSWAPSVNLYEADDHYLVCVDLAGVVKEAIDVQVVDQQLILKGSRSVPLHPNAEVGSGKQPPPRLRVHLMEIDHGAFSREVELPENAAQDRIRASYRNGLLWIEIPKRG